MTQTISGYCITINPPDGSL